MSGRLRHMTDIIHPSTSIVPPPTATYTILYSTLLYSTCSSLHAFLTTPRPPNNTSFLDVDFLVSGSDISYEKSGTGDPQRAIAAPQTTSG